MSVSLLVQPKYKSLNTLYRKCIKRHLPHFLCVHCARVVSLGADSLSADSLGADSLDADSLGADSASEHSLGADSASEHSLDADSASEHYLDADSLRPTKWCVKS